MQTKKKYLYLILLIFPLITSLSFNELKHPFYLSVTEIHVQTKSNLVQASCKIFTDDLQGAMFNWHGKSVNLEKKSKANDSLLAFFAENHLEIYLGKNKIRLAYLGYEIKEEAVWFYLEAITKIKSKDLKVINRLLCASVQGQSNVIHCTYDQSKLSHKLNCPEQEYVFRF